MTTEHEKSNSHEHNPSSAPSNRKEITTQAHVCHLKHDNIFDIQNNQPAYNQDLHLRQSIRHMVTFQHNISEREYGGYTPDAQLYEKLNLAWFKKVGLLKTVSLKFNGDYRAAIDFAWPGGLPSVSLDLDPTSKEFWHELKEDFEKIGYRWSIRHFLLHYSPDRDERAGEWMDGKYKKMWTDFVSNRGGSMEYFIRNGFEAPQDQPEFVTLVKQARELLEYKLRGGRLAPRFIEDKLNDQSFWDSFETDLKMLKKKTTFNIFMNSFKPESPDRLFSSVNNGKYATLLAGLKSLERQRDSQETESGNESDELQLKDSGLIFYEAAPLKLQLELSARFPKEFGKLSLSSLKEQGLVTNKVEPILSSVSVLNPYSQDRILESLTNYILANQDYDTTPIDRYVLKMNLEQAALSLRSETILSNEATLSNIVEKSKYLPEILEEASGNRKSSKTAKELLSGISEFYYLPHLKSIMYKPAALFWHAYVQEFGQQPNSKQLINFLEQHNQASINKLSETANKQIIEYVNRNVLPTLMEEFKSIADYAGKIKYLKDLDKEGNIKFLFLHQVEAIKLLIEKGNGIIADEPGTGKTLILALTTLNLFDQMPRNINRPRRALVVGSGTVIDNWENELPIHIKPDSFEMVNVNFSSDENTKQKMQLGRRLKRLEKVLEKPTNDKQIIMVNYDIFRNGEFRNLLEKYEFDSVIIDEAHNVKSRFLQSIDPGYEREITERKVVALRTKGLYDYIKTHRGVSVYEATSTPFVKELVEPLILAHLANPNLVPAEAIKELKDDPSATHRALREVMIRRKKEEIADLPPKETILSPVDLTHFTEEQQQDFIQAAEEIINTTAGFARFYTLLSLEGVAKYPWLIEKVNSIIEQGKKVVIFSPFVADEDRYTTAISTARIKQRLIESGINSVDVLDGSLNDQEKLSVQQNFKKAEGVKVLVGNYATAGESITLNSSENHATEVILFISPNSISRYIQAIDRIHRFGQEEKVTIHIPYATGDLLPWGSYDEKIVERLTSELSLFSAVVDGLFFMEPKDIFQTIAQSETNKFKGKIHFKLEKYAQDKLRQTKETNRNTPQPTSRLILKTGQIAPSETSEILSSALNKHQRTQMDSLSILEQSMDNPKFLEKLTDSQKSILKLCLKSGLNIQTKNRLATIFGTSIADIDGIIQNATQIARQFVPSNS